MRGRGQQQERLSREELEQLLRRAVARDARAETAEFTCDDLVAIGREIGLREQVLEQVYQEHLVRRQGSDGSLAHRPFDTQLRLDVTPERWELEIPSRGLRGAHVPALLFALSWMAFLAVWTGAAVTQGAMLAAAFSTPFWLVGATVLAGTAQDAGQRLRLVLDASGQGRLERRFGPPVELAVEHLRVRPKRKAGRTGNRGPHLALEHGTKTYRLLEGWSEAERRWVSAELQRWLSER